jgi:hypothetical protein
MKKNKGHMDIWKKTQYFQVYPAEIFVVGSKAIMAHICLWRRAGMLK